MISRVMAGKLPWGQAADVLGISDRSLRRLAGTLPEARLRRPAETVEEVLRLYA